MPRETGGASGAGQGSWAARLPLKTHLGLLRLRAFRRLWSAALTSRAGDVINFTALPLFAYAQTSSPAAVGALVIVEGVALIVGGTSAQLVVDRYEPRILLVAVDTVRAAAALTLALVPTYPTALVVTAVLALGTSWFSPTSSALVPRIVSASSLSAANALQWTSGVALQLIAAPLGGLLVNQGFARVAFGINALSFAGSALLLSGLPKQPAVGSGVTPWKQLPALTAALHQVPILTRLLVMQGLAALSVGATSALLVVLAERDYRLTGTGYGLWLAAIGAGALLGPFMVPGVARTPPARLVSRAFVIRGAGDIGLATVSNAYLGGTLLFIYGLNTSSGMVAFQTLVQQSVPAGFRARTFALLDVIWQAGRLLSIGLGSVAAGIVGSRPVFVWGGAMLICAGIYGRVAIRCLPALRDV